MNSAKFLQSSFHGTLAIGGSSDVGVLKDRLATCSKDLFRNRLPGRVDIRDDNRRAFAGEEQGGCASDAACGAGDEGDFPGQGCVFVGENHENSEPVKNPQRLQGADVRANFLAHRLAPELTQPGGEKEQVKGAESDQHS